MSSSQSIPFSEPPWLRGLPSPYFTETHRRWQKACQAFISEHLTENALEYERAGEVPKEVFRKFAEANFLVPNLPAPLPLDMLKRLGLSKIGGLIPAEEFDYLHTMIYWDEVCEVLEN